jgi:hypothetical protein
MELIRNLKSEVVHRPNCTSQKGANAPRWNWADGRTLDDIRQATHRYPWLHLCRNCLPGVCACGRCAS